MELYAFIVQLEELSHNQKLYGVKQINTKFLVLAFVNKMDRAGADFFNVYEQMKIRLKAKSNSYSSSYWSLKRFIGVVDLSKNESNYLE